VELRELAADPSLDHCRKSFRRAAFGERVAYLKKAKRGRHDFAFSGLIECARCGCAVVGEIKKQHYVYYHCTRLRR